MKRMIVVIFTLCIVLGMGCTTAYIDRPHTTDYEENFYIEIEIPPSLRSGQVTPQGMVNLSEMEFRVTRKGSKDQLTRTVQVEPDQDSVVAAFRLGVGDWYVEVIGLNDQGNVIFRDDKSATFWRNIRSNDWRPWGDDPFPKFVEKDKFDQELELEIVTIEKDKVNQANNITIEFEKCYVYVVLDLDDGWEVESGKISLEQAGRSEPYTFYEGENNIFKNPLFRHIPTGGWLVKADLTITDGTDIRNMKSSVFVELYGGELTTIQFTIGDENVPIGEIK